MLDPEQWVAVRLTLRVALMAVCGGLPVALLLAVLLARPRLAGRPLLDAAVHLPMVLPPVVTGWLLLLVFGVQGPVGGLLWRLFHVRLVFTTAGAALARCRLHLHGGHGASNGRQRMRADRRDRLRQEGGIVPSGRGVRRLQPAQPTVAID